MSPLLSYKYKEEFNKVFGCELTPLNKIREDIEKISLPKSIKENLFLNLPYSIYWRQIEKNFIYCNGGVGYGIFIATNFLSKLSYYWWVLTNKSIDQQQKDICSIEIEQCFYIIINCIYNAKEKWHKLLNFDKKKKTIITSILNSFGQNLINRNLDILYNTISDLCSARRYLVHDIYSIQFNFGDNNIYVSRSNFNLSEMNIWDKTDNQLNLKFTPTKLLFSFIQMEKCRKKILKDLINLKTLIKLN